LRFKDLRKQKKKPSNASKSPKEMQFHINIEENDVKRKCEKIKSFLEEKYKVKIVIIFKGREIQFQKRGTDLADKIILLTGGKAPNKPKLLGKQLTFILQ
jgi:translation initiation factor IF-3